MFDQLEPHTIVLGDKAYDGNAIRELIESQGAAPNIGAKTNRKWKPCFSKTLYRERNKVERFFSKLKHFRRIATRYDKLADNFLPSLAPAVRVQERHRIMLTVVIRATLLASTRERPVGHHEFFRNRLKLRRQCLFARALLCNSGCRHADQRAVTRTGVHSWTERLRRSMPVTLSG